MIIFSYFIYFQNMIRLVRLEDIKILAMIYKEVWNNVGVWELWSTESAENIMNYRYNKQPDLFFVAEEEWNPVGAIVSLVKPRCDWNKLIDGDLFVAKEWQKKHLWEQLLKKHLSEAKRLYNAKDIEFHTYGGEAEFPQNWYKRIWCSEEEGRIIMSWEIENILKHLE